MQARVFIRNQSSSQQPMLCTFPLFSGIVLTVVDLWLVSRLMTLNLCLEYPGFHGFPQSAQYSVLNLGEGTIFPESQKQRVSESGRCL